MKRYNKENNLSGNNNLVVSILLKVLEYILDFIFPRQFCPSCGLPSAGICPICLKDLNHYGKFSLPGDGDFPGEGEALYHYSGTFGNLIYGAKLKMSMEAVICIKELFISGTEHMSDIFSGDDTIITYVPSSDRMVNERGFDLGRILAVSLSQKYSVPLNGIFKNTSVKENKKLGRISRKENTEKCISFKKSREKTSEILKGKKVVLTDDVATTGYSLKRCRDLIIEAGIKPQDIFFIVAAKK